MNDHIIDEYKIFLYSEGELEEKEKEKTAEHISLCQDCRYTYEDYLKQKVLTKTYFTKIKTPVSPVKHTFRFNKKNIMRYAAVSIVLILVLFFFLYRSSDDTIIKTPTLQAGDNIFDTRSWTQDLYTIDTEIESFRQQIEEKPF